MKNRKGQVTLADAPSVIIALIIIGIVLAMGAIIIETVGDQTTTSGSAVQNITGIRTVAVVYNLTNTPVLSGSITYCNQTGGTALGSTNYTLYPGNATVVFHSNFLSGNFSYCYASYAYQQQSYSYNVTQSANEGIITFAGFQPVIAIVLVAMLILGLVALIAYARGV